MSRPLFAVFSAAFLLVAAPQPARALSCAPVEVNQEYISRAAAVFEGVVTAERKMDPNNKNVAHSSVFTFRVTKGWKGAAEGDSVEVSRNILWDGGFKMGDAYLVFAESRGADGVLISGLCGPTQALLHAEQLQDLLKKARGVTPPPPPGVDGNAGADE